MAKCYCIISLKVKTFSWESYELAGAKSDADSGHIAHRKLRDSFANSDGWLPLGWVKLDFRAWGKLKRKSHRWVCFYLQITCNLPILTVFNVAVQYWNLCKYRIIWTTSFGCLDLDAEWGCSEQEDFRGLDCVIEELHLLAWEYSLTHSLSFMLWYCSLWTCMSYIYKWRHINTWPKHG